MPVPLVETGADSDTATKSKLVCFTSVGDIPAFNRCGLAAFFDPVVVTTTLPFCISTPPFSLSLDRLNGEASLLRSVADERRGSV
jgi:hypothetical protein